MKILNKVLSLISISKTEKTEKKPSMIKEVMDCPEHFKLEAFIENDEIIVKIKRKETKEEESC